LATDRLGRSKVAAPRRVLFDSSFLIAVMEYPTPWLDDMLEKIGSFQPLVIQPVYDELTRLAEGKNRASRYASLAKEMVDRGELLLQKPNGSGMADDELISLALDEKALVATLDAELMEQLKALHIGVVTLSGGRVSL
jgi:rRNA-processing protein FCF1